ncbi:hypothetical protein U9M48_037388 [Paspalum notatum var. saurae]|uniref:Isopenicillin N synthase-like Fe(2+) 2OG dioxygenase domain-containing protein n=1 Tax=Paspalum notatum var. saurae TaxID=547442 RepID=A0AAQ3UEW4_PASNO
MAKMAAAAALDVAVLPFSDLALLLSPKTPADDSRRTRVLDTVAAELGRGGSGLLAVAGVPRAGALRRRLLPLARRLALMDHPARSQLLKDHGLGSDVPLKKLGRSVSSFAQLLRRSGRLALLESVSNAEKSINNGLEKVQEADGCEEADGDDDMVNLGELVKELGLYMMELGILMARACDIIIGGGQLEQSITEFGTAKARLIHYHSELDNSLIRENSTKGKRLVNKAAVKHHQSCSKGRSGSPCSCCMKSEDGTTVMAVQENDSKNTSVQGQAAEISLLNLWQEWHYDYGIFTVLTAPLFMRISEGEKGLISQECHPPDAHTHLQLCTGRKVSSVRCPPESFIVQIGEAADILSGGKLKSTLHAVSRPLGFTDISRETFVVFLQPSWDKTLTYSGNTLDAEDESIHSKDTLFASDGSAGPCDEDVFMQEIMRKIPPLSSRLKEALTFAEFSRQTTKQSHGARQGAAPYRLIMPEGGEPPIAELDCSGSSEGLE